MISDTEIGVAWDNNTCSTATGRVKLEDEAFEF
jgi:predicted RecA/RadA family phage recombinase